VERIAFPSFHMLFDSFNVGSVDEIIFPMENSIDGDVNPVMDYMLTSENAYLSSEVLFPVHHSLLCTKQVELSQITDIYSHPQPLAQCAKYLKTKCPKATLHNAASTASAALSIKENEGSKGLSAAIGHPLLANTYNLRVLDENIEDYENNLTRFGVLSRQRSVSTGQDKTSIVFSTAQDQPGSLADLLQEFSNRGINLTKITSRPFKNTFGHYLFYIDLEGHLDDPTVSEAVETLKQRCSYFKFLGSYRRSVC